MNNLAGIDTRPEAMIDRRLVRENLRRKAKIPGRIAWIKFMGSDAKNYTVAMLGEFIGTTFFLFFAFAGTQTANIDSIPNPKGNAPSGVADLAALMYISASFGISLLVNAWVFYRVSGGLFNPAVTLALTLTGDIPPLKALLLFISQLTGSCFSAYLVKKIFPSPMAFGTSLSNGTTLPQGLFIETLCTATLVFTILMLAREKHRATFIAPIGIGLALFISELSSVYYTGGSLNPARSFGPAAVAHEFGGEHWVYWVGPGMGAGLAVGFWWVLKGLEFEMANCGQDGDEGNDPSMNVDLEVAKRVVERRAEIEEIRRIEEEGGWGRLRDGGVGAGTVHSESGKEEKKNRVELRVEEVDGHDIDLEAQ